MTFAVIETGSKQYHLKVGDIISIERIDGDVGTVVTFDNVLAIGDRVGAPLLDSAHVKAEIISHQKSKKVLVFKKKRRHNYRRKNGHRQCVSVLRIQEFIS
ncbi:50S ribosomal protein L21 [Rickettsiales endosymbiont of Peranema trichophorum]|uniref:50S ribosomal protein L21 n=1 Tax=Rickettsiales endosymbiont of Peranema trichophorum TaxID=2486577 RepID=UPI001022B565|nr:50S ribosomal protein L21 [Rickettsiales endosymbiont of Peranema trichophorum]RZI45989.1 50S ribosomal protein L21 [Rickettsiales endosymbiont of Peranema trichophorum]